MSQEDDNALRITSVVVYECSSGFLYMKVKKQWVIPEKIHTSPTDGILEILTGGGVKDSGNPGRRGGFRNLRKSSVGAISTDSSRDSNV